MTIGVHKQANEFRNFQCCVDYKDLVQFTVYLKLAAGLNGNEFRQFHNEKPFVFITSMASRDWGCC